MAENHNTTTDTSEYWKTVVGFPDYEISTVGQVRQVSGRPMHPATTAQGYRRVTLRRNKRQISCLVHSLLLKTFIGPRPPGCASAHLDGNPAHNTIANLKWASYAENESHKTLHGTVAIGGRNHQSVLTDEKAQELLSLVKNWGPSGVRSNAGPLAKQFGIPVGVASRLIWGKTYPHLKRSWVPAARAQDRIVSRAAAEDGCQVSVGGLVGDLEDMERKREEPKCQSKS